MWKVETRSLPKLARIDPILHVERAGRGYRRGFVAGFFDAGGVRLMLSPPERPEFDHPGSILYYRVPDIARAYEELKSRGATFDGTPHVAHRDSRHELWLVSFRDTEGNTLVLMTEKPI